MFIVTQILEDIWTGDVSDFPTKSSALVVLSTSEATLRQPSHLPVTGQPNFSVSLLLSSTSLMMGLLLFKMPLQGIPDKGSCLVLWERIVEMETLFVVQ